MPYLAKSSTLLKNLKIGNIECGKHISHNVINTNVMNLDTHSPVSMERFPFFFLISSSIYTRVRHVVKNYFKKFLSVKKICRSTCLAPLKSAVKKATVITDPFMLG